MRIIGKYNCEKGASAVEFALVLPLLLVMLFGIIEFSLVLFNKAMITNASREGARAGIVSRAPRLPERNADPPGIIDIVEAYCSDHLVTFGSGTVSTTTTYDSDAEFGDDLKVTVSYPYKFLLIPNFVTSLGGGVTLSAETTMKYE